ncbi:MAG: S41 family peptidase [Bacillota bacterium]|nr:S41 family peptidase [Bacillota bacterium]
MLKKFTAVLLTLVLSITMAFPILAEDTNKALVGEDEYRAINEIATYVSNNYKFGVTSEKLKSNALEYILKTGDTNFDNVAKAMFEGLDDYSTYFTQKEYKSFIGNINATLTGIGVSVAYTGAGAGVSYVFSDSPAEKAGLKPFDVIVSIDGTSIVGKPLDDAVLLIKGNPGSIVNVGILREGVSDTLYYKIVRGNVEQNPVSWHKISDDIAYLELSTLTLNCDVFFRKALQEIDQAGIKKILLDLRDNPGGYLDATVNICGMLMPEGIVGYVDYKDPSKLETFYSYNKAPKYKMAVLINGATASGAEFLSGGLQDTKIGKLFGEKSFGKGTVQTTRALASGGAFKVTIAKYYTAKKQDVVENHINPDVVVKNSYKPINEDTFEPLNFDAELKVGSTGKAVLALQQRLCALGALDEADETFDENTLKAVREYKLSKGWNPTSEVDFKFLANLNDVEYNKLYKTEDHQLDAAVSYLKGLD